MTSRLVPLGAVLVLGCSLDSSCDDVCGAGSGSAAEFWINGQCANVDLACDTPTVPISPSSCDYPIYYKSEGPNQCRVAITCADGTTESLVVNWTSACDQPHAALADGGLSFGSWWACEGSRDDAAADASFDAHDEQQLDASVDAVSDAPTDVASGD